MSDQVVKKITEWPEVAPECDDPICTDDGCMVHGTARPGQLPDISWDPNASNMDDLTWEPFITLDGDVFKPGDQVDIRPNGEYFRIRREEPSGWESEVAQAFGLTPSQVYDRFEHVNCRSQIIDNPGIEVHQLPTPVDDDQGGYLIPDEFAEPLLEMMRRGEQPEVRFSFMAGGALCTPTRAGLFTRRMDPEAMRLNAEKYDQMIGQLDEAMANFTEGVARMAKRMVPVMERLVEVWSDLTEGMGDDDQESD